MEDNQNRVLFGRNIRYFRKLKKLTLEKCAELCGLDPKYLGGVERGEYNISFDNILSISKALGIESFLLFIFQKNDNANSLVQLISLLSNEKPNRIDFYKKIITDITDFIINDK
jgi:transcriptional regulator with XRE-family HTH domain